MADILIRGMEMPKDGHVIVRVYANGDVCEPTPCPGVWEKVARAVPIPEGHGKIIDADAIWRNMPDDQAWVFQRGLASDLELFEILEAAETIIPAEGGTDDV